MITFLWAQTKDGIIGNNNQLPWSIPEEMNHFKQTTLNHTILMGRKTFASMDYKPLPNRMNIILTKDTSPYKGLFMMKGLVFNDNVQSIVEEYTKQDSDELFVIGGSEVFKFFLPYVTKLIRSTIKKPYIGDVSMVKINYNEYIQTSTKDYKDFVVDTFIKKEK